MIRQRESLRPFRLMTLFAIVFFLSVATASSTERRCSAKPTIGSVLSSLYPSNLMPLNWMLMQRLNHEQRIQTHEWTNHCVAVAYQRLGNRAVTLSASDAMLFSQTAVDAELAQIEVPTCSGKWLNPVGARMDCETAGQRILSSVTERLNRLCTPDGDSMGQIWQEDLDITAQQVAKMLVLREVQAQRGAALKPAPRLIDWAR